MFIFHFCNRWKGGQLDICSICTILRCDANIHLDSAWIENQPRFTAFRFGVNGKQTALVTIPGEALVALG